MTPALTLEPQGFHWMRPWRSHPRETLAVGMLGAALLALAGVSGATPVLPGFGSSAVPEPVAALAKPLPTQIRDLAPETALQVNAQIPLADGPNPAARPFTLPNGANETRARALDCLTSAIYYEAGQESADGQR